MHRNVYELLQFQFVGLKIVNVHRMQIFGRNDHELFLVVQTLYIR